MGRSSSGRDLWVFQHICLSLWRWTSVEYFVVGTLVKGRNCFVLILKPFLLLDELLADSCHISIQVIELEIIACSLAKSLKFLFSEIKWAVLGRLNSAIMDIGWSLLFLLFLYFVICEYLLYWNFLTWFRSRFWSQLIYLDIAIEKGRLRKFIF